MATAKIITYIVIAYVLGGLSGVLATALCVSSRRDDDVLIVTENNEEEVLP